MTTTINGRTPEEIKKGLECCNTLYGCKQCPYDAGDEDLHCCVRRNADVLALINQLQEDKKQLEHERDEARNNLDTLSYANTELHSAYEAMKRERDAAVRDINRCCATCIHYNPKCGECTTNGCFQISGVNSKWQWRGMEVE